MNTFKKKIPIFFDATKGFTSKKHGSKNNIQTKTNKFRNLSFYTMRHANLIFNEYF